jgi:hypothetical protein
VAASNTDGWEDFILSGAWLGGVLCALMFAIGGCTRHRPAPAPPAAGCADSSWPSTPSSKMRLVPGKPSADVRGVVVFAETGEPVSQAALWIDSTTGAAVVTASDGRFAFPGVVPGRHQIVMRRIGLRGIRDTINAPIAGELRIVALWLGMDPCGEFGSVYVGKPQ